MKNNGSALLIVIILIFIMMLAGTAIYAMSENASFRMRRLLTSCQALNIAEAGIGDMIGKLSTDYIKWQNSTNSDTMGNGVFSTISELKPNGSVIITSYGTVNNTTRTTSIELLGTDRDKNDFLFSLNGAILSGGDVKFNTAAYTIRGNIHSNQKVTSANGAINGNLYAGIGNNSPSTITASGTIGNLNANCIPNSEFRRLPSFNFDSYRQLAIDGGLYYDVNKTFHNINLKPSNGIVYVNGNVKISNNSSLVGTIVANGDVIIENNFDQISFKEGTPAILATGNVIMGNRGRLNGLVYAGVNAFINNNVDILGGIISVGFMEINNNTDIYHPTVMPPWNPLQPSIPQEVIIGGWLC